MRKDRSYYEALGLEPGASSDEVKAAYRAKAKEHHPDAGGNAEAFKEVQEAYEVLSDQDARRAYDEHGAKGSPRAQREAEAMLVNAFVGIVAQCPDPENMDIIGGVREALQTALGQQTRTSVDQGTAATRFMRAAARIAPPKKERPGGDPVRVALCRSAEVARAAAEAAEQGAETTKLALSMLDSYKQSAPSRRAVESRYTWSPY